MAQKRQPIAGWTAAAWPKSVTLREIMEAVPNAVRWLRSGGLTLLLGVSCCFGQSVAPTASPSSNAVPAPAVQVGEKLSPELAWKIEVMIRARSGIGPDYLVAIGNRTKSEVAGFDQVPVIISVNGNSSRPMTFLISADDKMLAQFNKFDISADPKAKVSGVGRPSRGGSEVAPVQIVGFDDLQCPVCSRMHAELFPAIVDRYKDQVHVVYLDFPLVDIHSWAMRAAVDANCLAAQSPTGYWNYVDYVHAHYTEIGGKDSPTPEKAKSDLDGLVQEEGARQKVNATDLAACITKQDDSRMQVSLHTGESLGVDGTPTLFINGEKVDGLTAIENVFRVIDGALTAAGQTPPPPYIPPPASPTVAPVPPSKPGN